MVYTDYLWIIPLIPLGIGMFMLTSPYVEHRLAGYNWIFWASTISLFLIFAGYDNMWSWWGVVGLIYSFYGYYRIMPQEPTAKEIEEESGVYIQ